SYSNLGFMLAAGIAERIVGMSFRQYLRSFLFEPLGMRDTSLGLGGRSIEDTAAGHDNPVITPYDLYWRDFGAPWNGVNSTAGDVPKYLHAFMMREGGVISRETAQAMIAIQTAGLKAVSGGRIGQMLSRIGLPVSTREAAEPWGLGWMLGRRAFGPFCSRRTF